MSDSVKKRNHFGIVLRILGLFLLLVATACENPLVGLGSRVDLTPPEGTVTGIANGDYVSGDITLTGTVQDDKEVDGVWAEINGVTVSGVVNPDGSWSIDIDTTDVAYAPDGLNSDGEHDITISLRDTSGKVTEKQMLLFFDNTPPVLMVTLPELSSPQDTSPIVLRGEAYDPLRLKEVRATVGQGTFTLSANSGTADSWLFNLTHSIPGTETLGVILEAEDLAGNISTAVFHAKDLRYLNNDISITVIDLYNLVDGTALPGATITPNDVLQTTFHSGLPSSSSSTHLTFGLGTDGLPVDVDMSGDIPQITVTTPNPNIPIPGDTMGPASEVNGSIFDNVEVDESSVEIRFLASDGTTEVISWAPVTIIPAQIINDQNINFSYALPGSLVDANYNVQLKVLDNNRTEGVTLPIPFRLDGNAPVIAITAPALSAYIPDTGTFITGTADDSESILVEISLDGTNWETVTTLARPGSDVDWSYQISDWETVYGMSVFNDFDTIPISARATANGTTTYTNSSVILDRVAPVIEFLTPPDSRDGSGVITGDVNGVVTLRVADSDDSLYSVSYKIGINGPVQAVDSGSLYNWSDIIVTPLMEDPNLATEISPGIWELPVTVTAIDKAGNTTVTSDYTMIIDNAQDRPNVIVIYPIEGESYGGEVTVSGLATDDDGTVGAVYVQVDLDTLSGGTPDFSDVHTLTDGIDFDGNGPVTNIDESAAYQVSGLSSWSFPLNSTGELYDMGGGHNGDIYVRVWAEDPINPLVTSVPQLLHFRFDDTLPHIDSVLLDTVPVASNAYVSGTVDLNVTVSDDTQINKLEVSYDNGVSWEDRSVTPAQTVVESISIDTVAKVSGGNGILYLRLKATDNTGYTTLEVLPLNVDNNAPEGTYPGTPPFVLNGTESLLQGTASDPNGSIAGVDKIEVYLERSGKLYNPLTTYPYTNPATPDIDTEETTFGAGIYYPVDPAGAGVMVIDDVNEQGSDAVLGDGDGFNESLTLVASTWNWWVKFNSENIPDGDINIHYVVVDKAGNKTHYSEAARIENNPPVIISVRLGTDINYNANVDSTVGNGETFRYIDGSGTDGSGIYYVDFDSAVSGITTRNNLLFVDADESLVDGNGVHGLWTWELLYKGGGTNHLGVGTDSVTISDFTLMPDETGVSYILRITDDAGLTDEVELIIDLDNTDTTSPVVTLTDLDLNLNFSILARGGASNYGYAVNGYNPSAQPKWKDADGRLRPVGSSPVYDGSDADVSGTIIVSGKVEEDKAIHQLTLTIDGYNGGLGAGNAFPILDWDPSANSGLGGLKVASSVTGTPHISSESYGESSGHVVFWSFGFDTATITGTAADNVQLTAIAMDKTSNTGNDSYTMDVMPFVSDIFISESSYTAENDIFRTRYGSWPVYEDAYLKIKGFNLSTTVGLVPGSSSDSLIPDLAAVYTNLDSPAVNAGRTELNGQILNISNSGWLAMETNSVPLMNYSSDFDENDLTVPGWSGDALWNDNRYIVVWEITKDIIDSGDAVWGSMAGDPVDGSMWGSWSFYSNSDSFVADGPTGGSGSVKTNIFHIYDPPEYTEIALNDDGSPYVVYLANFYGGTGDWDTGAGGLVLWGDNANLWNNSNAPRYPYGSRTTVSLEEIERFTDNQQLYQFKNPKLAVRGDNTIGTDIHISYYDAASKALKYAHLFDDGSDIYNLTFVSTQDGNTDNKQYLYDNTAFQDTNILAGDAATSGSTDMGMYSDITLDSAGRPVIAYYDTEHATLRMIRATTATPTNYPGDWVDQAILSNYSYVGKYPSIQLDSDDRVHISAYKISTGDLMYYSAPDPGAGNSYIFDTFTNVDSTGNVGAYSALELLYDTSDTNFDLLGVSDNTNNRPVIGYMDSAYVGTFSGMKFAYLRDDGEWEHGTVPLLNVVENAPLSAVAKPADLLTVPAVPNQYADDVNYLMAIGFHSSRYRYARLRPEL